MQNSTFLKTYVGAFLLLCCMWTSQAQAEDLLDESKAKAEATTNSGFALQELPPIVVGTSQPLEVLIPIMGGADYVIIEAGFSASKPAWLNAAPTADGKAVRVWGTPPSNGWGTYTPTVYAIAQGSTIRVNRQISIRVGNCKNQIWYKDADGDGFGGTITQLSACWQPTGYISKGGDCNDNDATINPAATEVDGDGKDNNCDGQGENPAENTAPTITLTGLQDYYKSGQEYTVTIEAKDPDGDELTLSVEDLTSANAEIISFSPALPASGNGTVTATIKIYTDGGSQELGFNLTATDQYGAAKTESVFMYISKPVAFYPPADTVYIGVNQPFTIQIDYVDQPDNLGNGIGGLPFGIGYETLEYTSELEPSLYPTEEHIGAHVLTYTAYQQFYKTNGSIVVIVDPSCNNEALYTDKDGDGFGTGTKPRQTICNKGLTGLAANNKDCNDKNAAVNPDATEVAGDGIDNNCNGTVDEKASTIAFDIPADPIRIGIQQPFIFTIGYKNNGDNGIYAEGISELPFGLSDPDRMHLYADAASNWATAEHVGTYKVEVWAIDNNGTKVTDTLTLVVEADCKNVGWYRDTDGDNYGTGSQRQLTCSAWEGHASNNTDCNDSNAAVNPGAEEVAGDGIDNNCNGTVDEGTTTPFALQQIPAIVVGTSQALEVFIPVEGGAHLIASTGFTGSKPAWLSVEKTTDGKALRVWGTTPSNGWGTYYPVVWAKTTAGQEASQKLQIRVGNCKNQVWYADKDGDGFGAIESKLSACWQPAGYIAKGGDCDDTDATVQTNCTPSEENVAPVITLLNYNPDKEYYPAGEEHLFVVQVTDANPGQALTLSVEFNDVTAEELSFSPALPVIGTDTLLLEVRWTPRMDKPGRLSITYTAQDAAGAKTAKGMGDNPYIPTIIYMPTEPVVIGVDQPFQIALDFQADNEDYPLCSIRAPEWASGDESYNHTLLLTNAEGRYPTMADVGTYQIPVYVSYPWGTTTDTLTVVVEAGCTNEYWYADSDKDGYGDSMIWSDQLTCSSWETYEGPWYGKYVQNDTDCNDRDAAINPGAEEITDGIDNNCNGLKDENTGVSYRYYKGNWSMLPDFSQLQPVRTGILANFTIPALPDNPEYNYFGFAYSAMLEIKNSGTYTFYTNSDDGSKLYINGKEIVNNDGIHGFRDASGSIYLTAGSHAIEVTYFERTGSFQGIKVSYAGPSFGRTAIPNELLRPAGFGDSAAKTATTSQMQAAEAVQSQGLEQFAAYPNPVKDILTIATGVETEAPVEVEIFNLQGASIYKGQHQTEVATGHIQLDLNDLKQGVYMLRVKGDGLQQTIKIVKE